MCKRGKSENKSVKMMSKEGEKKQLVEVDPEWRKECFTWKHGTCVFTWQDC